MGFSLGKLLVLGVHPFDLAFEYIEHGSYQRVFHHLFRRRPTELRGWLSAFRGSFHCWRRLRFDYLNLATMA